MEGWRDVVRDGYDAMSYAYRGDDDEVPSYRGWVDDLLRRLPPRDAVVVDLGCGCGVPVVRDLTTAGHRVTGVDVSPVQLERAGRLVPDATFIEADLSSVTFGPGVVDAVVCLYALIHLPDEEQRRTVDHVASWLRPGGVFLATVGATRWTGVDPDRRGAGAAMWWNHPDAATFRSWLHAAGLVVETDAFVPERSTGHQFIVATRPVDAG